MNLLIPYVPRVNHLDPDLQEFTYGDHEARARKLSSSLEHGDHVFFHTSINGRKVITAYYVVDRVLDSVEAVKDKRITAKYKNPHLHDGYEEHRSQHDDVIVFGDPILSRKLERPLPFDRELAHGLSLAIPFKSEVPDSRTIGSATRQWRQLSDSDVEVLLGRISEYERAGPAIGEMLSTEEVGEVIEKDLENYIEANAELLGSGLSLKGRQIDTQVGRIDLLFEATGGELLVVELKLGRIGREAVSQLRRYMDHIGNQSSRVVRGVIVCAGILPVFEEELARLKDIKVLRYGWKVALSEIRTGK